MIERIARYVAGASGSRSMHLQSFLSGSLDFWVARHAQVVVGAPHRDGFFTPGVLEGRWKFALGSQSIDFLEDSVRVVLFLEEDLVAEEVLVGECFRKICSIGQRLVGGGGGSVRDGTRGGPGGGGGEGGRGRGRGRGGEGAPHDRALLAELLHQHGTVVLDVRDAELVEEGARHDEASSRDVTLDVE